MRIKKIPQLLVELYFMSILFHAIKIREMKKRKKDLHVVNSESSILRFRDK